MIYATVPVKRLDWAKGRLAGVLSAVERRALVLAMLEDVLGALRATPGLAGVGVISRDAAVLARAAELGVDALLDQSNDLNGALAESARFYTRAGASAILALPADVPLVTPSDLADLLRLDDGRPGVAIAPSSDGGTNALLVRPPGAIPYRFGPGSLALHREAALARGLPFRRCAASGLALDIDRPDDLLRLAEHWTTAAGTLVQELQIAERMVWV